MLEIIITTAFSFFGAVAGLGIYLAGKKAGKAEAAKEHMRTMTESFCKNSPMADLISLMFTGALFGGITPPGYTPKPTASTEPFHSNSK